MHETREHQHAEGMQHQDKEEIGDQPWGAAGVSVTRLFFSR